MGEDMRIFQSVLVALALTGEPVQNGELSSE